MDAILLKAGGFLLIILIGYVFKRLGIFQLEDSQFLTKLIMRVTLPAAIFTGFHGVVLSPTLLIATLLGFVLNVIMIGVALLVSRRKAPAERAYYIINTSSYNIGNFTIPFTQAFFPPEAIAIVCMFDVGNALMCFGVTFAIAKWISAGAGGYSLSMAAKTLFSSMPFCTHLVMITFCALKITLPEALFTIGSMIGSANSFLAMLLIGILFATKMEKAQAIGIVQILGMRIVFAILFALFIFHFLPVPLMMRIVLIIAVFSPILSVAPIHSERCGYDKSVAAVLNSLAIPISMIAMTLLLIWFPI